MRDEKSRPDTEAYNQGERTRSRCLIRRPHDARISDSANAIRIEMMTELNSKSEMSRLRGTQLDRPAIPPRKLPNGCSRRYSNTNGSPSANPEWPQKPLALNQARITLAFTLERPGLSSRSPR